MHTKSTWFICVAVLVMAFIKPFPVVQKVPGQGSCMENDLPAFTKSEFCNSTVIGMGSFGKVLRVTKENQIYVIKEFNKTDASELELKLFCKEAQLLKSLTGCENIVQFHAFSMDECAILLEYCSFTFEPLQIEHDAVYNLKEFLTACDRMTDYKGFEHVQQHVAVDIASGLAYMHQRNIAHRDLKPHNILVSNRHYCDEKQVDKIQYWWSTRPAVAKLSDFGESRASLLQTRSVVQSRTQNLNRGSPAYMAPEALIGSTKTADIRDLKSMDMWSVAMTLFHLLNPSARHPYAEEINSLSNVPVVDQLKTFMLNKQLPLHIAKYKMMQVKVTILFLPSLRLRSCEKSLDLKRTVTINAATCYTVCSECI
jgi:serine/threonine protein kinase